MSYGKTRREGREVEQVKQLLMLIIILTTVPAAVPAELPPTGNIGLYADAARQYYAYCPFFVGYPVAKVELWIWCLPSTQGMRCAEFAIGYPTNVVRDRIIYSPLLSSTQGDLVGGLSACFASCQMDWCWIAHQSLYVVDHQASYAEIIPHPGVGLYRFFNCESESCCYEPCLRGTTLYLNSNVSPCLPPELAIGTDGSTWGALKGLFAE
jgi:hypothetical protein